MAKLEGVIFDWDGTVNTGANEVYKEIISDSLAALDVPISEAEQTVIIEAEWGAGMPDIIKTLCESVGQPDITAEVLKVYLRKIHESFTDRVRPVEGVAGVLGRLSVKKYKLAVDTATNKELLVSKFMPSLGIDPALFSEIISAEDLPDPAMRKPDPYTVQRILYHQELSRKHTIMVGDSDVDVFAAVFSGVEPVVVLTGNIKSVDEAIEIGVLEQNVIPDITHLERVIGRLESQPRRT